MERGRRREILRKLTNLLFGGLNAGAARAGERVRTACGSGRALCSCGRVVDEVKKKARPLPQAVLTCGRMSRIGASRTWIEIIRQNRILDDEASNGSS